MVGSLPCFKRMFWGYPLTGEAPTHQPRKLTNFEWSCEQYQFFKLVLQQLVKRDQFLINIASKSFTAVLTKNVMSEIPLVGPGLHQVVDGFLGLICEILSRW